MADAGTDGAVLDAEGEAADHLKSMLDAAVRKTRGPATSLNGATRGDAD